MRVIPVIVTLWLTLSFRAFGEVSLVVVTYPDHSTETYPYLGESKSNLVVEIYGKPMSLAWSNIVSAQINSPREPASAAMASSNQPQAAPVLLDSVTSIRLFVQRQWSLVIASVALILVGWGYRDAIRFHAQRAVWFLASLKRFLPGRHRDKSGIVPVHARDELTREKADQMLKEHRFGTAAEILEQELQFRPDNFELWLSYAEVHGFYCGDVLRAERIIQQMERLRTFSDEQMQQAVVKLRQWREKHPLRFRVH